MVKGVVLALTLAVAGCHQSQPSELDVALECSVRLAATASAEGKLALSSVLENLRSASPATRLTALHALARELHAPTDQVRLAKALSEAGDASGVRMATEIALADAKGKPASYARPLVAFSALALARIGEVERADELVKEHSVDRLAVGVAAAGGGHRAEAEHLLEAVGATLPTDRATIGGPEMLWHAERAQLLLHLGRLDDARAERDLVIDPMQHVQAAEAVAREALQEHLATASAVVHEAADIATHATVTGDARKHLQLLQLTIAWELDQVGDREGSKAARAALAAVADSNVFEQLALYAQQAREPAEADRWLAASAAGFDDTALAIAVDRGEVDTVFAGLPKLAARRAEAQLFAWQVLAGQPPASAQLARFASAACQQ